MNNSPYSIEISHGVEVLIGGEYSDMVSHRSVVNIDYMGLSKPKIGDEARIGDKTYKLDVLLTDDGYSSRWVVT